MGKGHDVRALRSLLLALTSLPHHSRPSFLSVGDGFRREQRFLISRHAVSFYLLDTAYE